jgi:hypothetical protein
VADFVDVEVETTAEALAQDAIEAIQAQWPDWFPADGNLETVMINAFARMAADLSTLAADVPIEIFKQFGATVVGVPPLAAIEATGESTWTMTDNAGYTITEGTQVGIPLAGDQLIGFEVLEDVVVPPGSTTTAAGEVILQALEPGIAGNGLLDAPQLLTLTLDYVTGIALTAPTHGGEDAEDEDAYLNRLTNELRLLTPRPIIPVDFAVLVLNLAGVGRTLAIDGYNPADNTYNNERMVTVALVDPQGEPVGAPLLAAAEALLEAKREINFVVNAINPTYTEIDATAAVKVYPNFDPATVEANVVAALTAYLDPANWGKPTFGDPGTNGGWLLQTKVRYNEIVTVIENTPGVDYIETLTIGIHLGAMGTANLDLAGVAPLTQPGTFTITADA